MFDFSRNATPLILSSECRHVTDGKLMNIQIWNMLSTHHRCFLMLNYNYLSLFVCIRWVSQVRLIHEMIRRLHLEMDDVHHRLLLRRHPKQRKMNSQLKVYDHFNVPVVYCNTWLTWLIWLRNTSLSCSPSLS